MLLQMKQGLYQSMGSPAKPRAVLIYSMVDSAYLKNGNAAGALCMDKP